MIGVGIFDGDLFIVDCVVVVILLDVIVVNLNGSFVCKFYDRNF